MYLVFVKSAEISDFQGNRVYEFIFTDYPDSCWDESWGGYFPEPPTVDFISEVAIVRTDVYTFSTYYKHHIFTMFDVQDGIMPLAYEELDYNDHDDIFIKDRMVFPFKMSKEEFIQIITKKGLKVEWTK